MSSLSADVSKISKIKPRHDHTPVTSKLSSPGQMGHAAALAHLATLIADDHFLSQRELSMSGGLISSANIMSHTPRILYKPSACEASLAVAAFLRLIYFKIPLIAMGIHARLKPKLSDTQKEPSTTTG